MKEPVVIYEHTTDADLGDNYVDGMEFAMGDDVLPSDYNVALGEIWPGVDKKAIPEEWLKMLKERFPEAYKDY